ncbi:ImmA/IrrE family metallo-endopeptidase [Natranaerobius trueperi]|uniref:IrrE N-terminal-like domain-containing protein n=1 Tax=Natranaerobius trueperi TaxID=759412 RepID=A0A226BYT3_9FIRM|nr:hypothetical protein [Natranaerobius trueperi]OWZ83359.1 hypothetical protein CDO51_09065 [Natranaerobius trueperi]
MSIKPITKDCLEQVMQQNSSIKEQIYGLVSDFNKRFNKSGLTAQEKQAFSVLKENNLIQIPIEDEHWGGAIIAKGGMKIPVINTAQPRVYQYFVAWHEIYHLLYDINLDEKTHNVAIDMDINERKADYFAAKMIFGDIYKYYYSLEDENVIDRIIKCMDAYKAPYKATLIELYEQAVEVYGDMDLKHTVLNHFDDKPKNLEGKFEGLELDPELVRSSFVISFGGLEQKVKKAINQNTGVSYHKDNYEFLIELKKEIKKEWEDLSK